jgi:hypothetical protein
MLFDKILVVKFNIKYLVVVSHKKTIFNTWKIENELFMRRKGKHPKQTLFAIQSRTHLHKMGSFEQTMP